MFPATYPRIPAHQSHRRRRGWPQRGAPIKRRPCFRPKLERVEDRCLLSIYNLPIDLGTLGTSILQSHATAINSTTGQVVGSAQVVPGDTNSYHPFLWTAGGTDGVPSNPQMKDLGTLVPGGHGWATDINDSGQVVGWSDSGQIDPYGKSISHAFLWTPGGTDGVPSNPQMKDLQITWGGLGALALNNSGVVVGNEATTAGPYHGFVWDQTHGLRDLNILVPGNLGVELRYATGVNSQGQIVANGWNAASPDHAYLLSDNNADGDFQDPNEVTDLGKLPIGTSADASAINDVGQVAGSSGDHAFRWQNGHMKNLGQLHAHGTYATSINNNGDVVGGAANLGYAGAWLSTGSGNIKDLATLIPRNSGWFFDQASGINDVGTIVGFGTPTAGGTTHAFLVTPTSAPAAAVTISAASLTAAKTLDLATVEAGARSTHSRTDAPSSSVGLQDSLILIALTLASDEDLTPSVTELIRSGTKRPRPALQS
jgi:probable HAF family extracellular repeat protein